MKSNLKKNLILMLTALIWGTGFVSQSIGTGYVGPCTFLAMRSYIGGIALLPCIFFLGKVAPSDSGSAVKKDTKTLIIGGICCGAALFCASIFQQIGIMHTTVGKAGFLTALYIIIVPVLGLFFKKKVGLNIWISALIAVFGMYLLCVKESFAIGQGDMLVMLCAFMFSVHILVIDHFSPKVDCVKMSCIQFFVCAVISTVFMFALETPDFASLWSAKTAILYSGILSSGMGYTLQIIGQQGNDPTVSSLILSLESVFSMISGWIVLHEKFSPKEAIGSLLIFAAIILSQLPKEIFQKICGKGRRNLNV